MFRRKRSKKELCEEKGHRFDAMPQAMENIPLGTYKLAHTTLMLVPCSRCLRAHEEFGDNSTFMTEGFRKELKEMFTERGHEVFLAEKKVWE